MNYNVAALRNRWESTGILNSTTTPKQQIKLARHLDKVVDYILNLGDDEIHEKAGDIAISVIIVLFDKIHVRNLADETIEHKTLLEGLRSSDHKIDIIDLVEMTNDFVENEYKDVNDFFKQHRFDMSLRDRIINAYIVKYGTE